MNNRRLKKLRLTKKKPARKQRLNQIDAYLKFVDSINNRDCISKYVSLN